MLPHVDKKHALEMSENDDGVVDYQEVDNRN